ncbi:cytochrome [Crocosphaera sp. XPORK-15E]|uniref:cytochrome n=1 Tax=Crocosphaera sp. XPORK-15E TaxID=3110247 RepID=UPI002B21A142|nr:cytochrome [Crocosphaera sp. XPORK-15E]MEA5534872.1 cytochrome [Crocosphaera sp. XPORK-15E]
MSFVISLAIALWCVSIGWSFTQALETSPILAQSQNPLRPRTEVGKELYVSTCSGCHIPIPPEVLPTETWQELLEKPNKHYGTSIPNFIRLSQVLIWDYLKTSSRPILIKEAPIPFYIEQSQYFKILHPRVEFTEPITHKSCIVCHPGVKQFDYRTLTPEWKDSP